jgi:type IV pilus assembly protein PilM
VEAQSVSNSVVGLDIGSSGIRAVQVRNRKGKPRVEKAGFASLDRGVIENGEIRDAAKLTAAIKEMWAKHKFVKQVALGLSNGEVLVRMINLEWMPPADFKKALPYQVADHLAGVPVEEMYLDYHQVSETVTVVDGKEQRWNTILFVAAKRNMVEAFVDAVQAAGLMPVKANITPFALIAAAPHIDLNPETAEAIIDLGADMINVVCHQGGQPVYVRTIPGAGGNNVTRDMAQQFGYDWDDAEQRKVSLGLSTTVITESSNDPSVFGGATAGTHIAQDSPEQVLINQRMGMLVAEVRSTLDFFLNSNHLVGSLTKITLTGGGAAMHGLAARLSGEMRIPVAAIQPFEGLALAKDVAADVATQEHRLAVAVGLGMGAA